MKLEAVTICIGYSRLLEVTLEKNAKHFDNHVIVTSLDDARTETLCKKLDVQFVKTDRITEQGHFKKGKGINDGFVALGKEDWILHMDADIILPPNFRDALESFDLDQVCLYGCTRKCQVNRDQFFYHNSDDLWIHENSNVIGFFQLFNALFFRDKPLPWYPELSFDCGYDDILFSDQWNSENRKMLPKDFEVLHLGNPYEPQRWRGLSSPDQLYEQDERQTTKLSANIKEVLEKQRKKYKLF